MFLLIEALSPKNSQASLSSPTRFEVRRGNTRISVRDQERTLLVQIRYRQAYPGVFCEHRADGSIFIGYGSRVTQDQDEFLHITLGTDGSIQIQRDVQCTLPVFYGQSGDVFVVSNEYQEVVNRLPRLTLNTTSLVKNLLNITPAKQYTLWKEVGILGERESLIFRKHMPIYAPSAPARPWAYSTELAPTDPRAFPAILADRFAHFINTRLKNSRVGFELSGGLDSAFLPLFMSARGYTTSYPAATLVQPDHSQRSRQLQKIQELETRTFLRSNRIHLDIERHYPLSDIIRSDEPQPFDHNRDIFHEATGEIADYFSSLDVEVAVTGAGGDQLLEHLPHPSLTTNAPYDNYHVVIPEFLTTLCKTPLEAKEPFAPPATLLSAAVGYENIAQANSYINRGIWPVSPFYDVHLFNFCQALPVQFRANKNIYRAYFEANGFPESLYRGPNEDFGSFIQMCFLSGKYDKLIEQLAGQSVTGKLGYVDPEKLMAAFLEARWDTGNIRVFSSIYTWAEVELNLLSTTNWTGATTESIS